VSLLDRLRVFRHRIRATRTGRVTLRIAVGLLGAMIVTLGLILIPFPGPGWLIVLFGLAIWALEFVWAARLLAFTKGKLESWWHWLSRQHWSVRVVAVAVGLGFVLAVTYTTLYFSFDVRSWGDFWRFITPA
jgi:uncharacterized protein (TIGR02611 family)